ncbi:MAG TPA: HAD family hydrolase [Stellaceae bacterium]
MTTPSPAALPRAVLFDWDNTLVDSWGTIHNALNVTLAAMGHPVWSIEETKERVRLSLRDSFPRLFGARWEEARQLYLDTFQRTHLERLALLPGAAELLGLLGDRGVALGVVSNKTGRILRREAEHLGWTGLFHRLVGAGDAIADKPARDPVDLALDGTGVAPGDDVWFIGDTAVDIECALAAGCVPLLVGETPPDGDDTPIFQARWRFDGCLALFHYLRDL